jgi:hypothetical protein
MALQLLKLFLATATFPKSTPPLSPQPQIPHFHCFIPSAFAHTDEIQTATNDLKTTETALALQYLAHPHHLKENSPSTTPNAHSSSLF